MSVHDSMFSSVAPATNKFTTSIEQHLLMIYLSIVGFNIELGYKGKFECQTGASQILLYPVPPRTLLAFVKPFAAATVIKKYRLILIDWTLCPLSYGTQFRISALPTRFTTAMPNRYSNIR